MSVFNHILNFNSKKTNASRKQFNSSAWPFARVSSAWSEPIFFGIEFLSVRNECVWIEAWHWLELSLVCPIWPTIVVWKSKSARQCSALKFPWTSPTNRRSLQWNPTSWTLLNASLRWNGLLWMKFVQYYSLPLTWKTNDFQLSGVDCTSSSLNIIMVHLPRFIERLFEFTDAFEVLNRSFWYVHIVADWIAVRQTMTLAQHTISIERSFGFFMTLSIKYRAHFGVINSCIEECSLFIALAF